MELRFTPAGEPVARFRLAINRPRLDKQTGSREDGETTYLPVTAWDRLAENTAESLRKGDRVTVAGEIRARSYTTKDNEPRTVLEVTATEIGLGLEIHPGPRDRATPGQPGPGRHRPRQRGGSAVLVGHQ